jgi:predicted site-specific integrase-resolvase
VLDDDVSVTIEAAAELAGVDVQTMREWSASGSLRIERRGDMEVVHLERVNVLASTFKRRVGAQRLQRDSLRARLRDTTPSESSDHVEVLQELVRERKR